MDTNGVRFGWMGRQIQTVCAVMTMCNMCLQTSYVARCERDNMITLLIVKNHCESIMTRIILNLYQNLSPPHIPVPAPHIDMQYNTVHVNNTQYMTAFVALSKQDILYYIINIICIAETVPVNSE